MIVYTPGPSELAQRLARALRDASLRLDEVERGRAVAADEPAHRTPSRVVSGPDRSVVVRAGWGERPPHH